MSVGTKLVDEVGGDSEHDQRRNPMDDMVGDDGRAMSWVRGLSGSAVVVGCVSASHWDKLVMRKLFESRLDEV